MNKREKHFGWLHGNQITSLLFINKSRKDYLCLKKGKLFSDFFKNRVEHFVGKPGTPNNQFSKMSFGILALGPTLFDQMAFSQMAGHRYTIVLIEH